MKSNVVTKVMGGFGNQLFCYACGYAVAKEGNRNLIIDTSQQDNDSFRKVDLVKLNIQYKRRVTFEKTTGVLGRFIVNRIKLIKEIGFLPVKVKEKRPYSFQESIFNNKKQNIYLDGYWQSEKYFKKYRADLLAMFTPQMVFASKSKYGIKGACVAIHIRRGDYIKIGCNIDDGYYENAINYFKNKIGADLVFLIFSDDVDYANQFAEAHPDLKMIVVCSEGDEQTLEDFYLMTSCDHFIIANSSYSWWAAWLGRNPKKIVVCPEVDFWTGDFYPDEWKKIDAKIMQEEND